MTTPNPPGTGGFINNLLGGLTGTLAGANPLQSSVDQLTNAVNRLTNSIGTLGLGSARTQQQTTSAGSNGRFPPVFVPGVNRMPGIGGGGPGGTGNIPRIAGPAMLLSALAGYGQQQMPFQIGLNAYATMSMMGMNGAGMGNFGRNFSSLANQPGIPITSSPMDYLAMMQGMSFLAGSPRYMSTALGRAGFGATSAFGLTNPTLSGAMSANLAQQIYNPMLSMRMRLLGYSLTPRTMGTGMPNAIGNVVASLLQGWYGNSRVSQSQLQRTLSMGGKGFTNLQYLGLNPQQMTPLMLGFNQLFNAGMSPQQASNLFSQAASNNRSVSSRAQATLTRLGVTTVSSDIQKLRNNQAQLTQRSVNTAAGFDSALTGATDSLMRFNAALNDILNRLGLNFGLGYGGGLAGVMSGTLHGNGLLGLGGAALMVRGLLGDGGGGLLGGGAAGGAAALGLGGRLGAAALRLGPAAAMLFGLSKIHNSNGTNWLQQGPGGPHSGWNSWSGAGKDLRNWLWNDPEHFLTSLFGGRSTSQNIGGGASLPRSSQQSMSNSNPVGGGVSASAVKAVAAAESQVGVPYVWGGEMPGVGFDCCLTADSLVQTTDGPKPIIDIKPGDSVYTWDYGWVGVHNVLARSEPRYQRTYKLSTNRRTIEASANHPFHVIKYGLNKKPYLAWIRLDELKISDYIVVLDSLPENTLLVEVEQEYLWFLGAMFGDGHLSKDGRHIYLCLSGSERDYAAVVLKKLTNNKITYHENHGMYLSDASLWQRLYSDGMNKRSSDRTLPSWVWKLSHDQMEEFLEGYTDADGSFGKTGSYEVIEFKASNKMLIRQIRNLFLVLGVNTSKISVTKRTKPVQIKGKIVKDAKDLYCFEAYPASARKANGFLGSRPDVAKLFPKDNFMPEKIISITELGEQETYDIEVEGAHNFIAEGINVHNSGLIQWAYKQAGVNLPRTSEQQWSALRRKSVPLGSVREGDLVFMAGADGTPNNPGHVGMMISNRSLIEAPSTGQDVKIIGYNPKEWSHAARPSGSLGNLGVSSNLPGNNTGNSSITGLFGNTGRGMGLGNYGSVNEADILNALGVAGGGMTGAGLAGAGARLSTSSQKLSGGIGNTTSAPKNIKALQAIAMQLLVQRGWGNQFGSLNNIVMAESGWRVNAQNPSGAYGIPQALPGSKMAAAGADWRTNGATQLKWLIDMYIPQRYGTPNQAWQFHQQHGWYSVGGSNLPPGYKWVGERGPELAWTGGGSNILDNAKSMALMKAVNSQPAQSPWRTVADQMKYGGNVIHPGQRSDAHVNMTFGPNSIVIKVSTTTSDVQSTGRALAKEFVGHLESELLLSTIAQGVKN